MFKVKNIYMNPNGTYPVTEGTANLYRIYKNPKAKDLFIKARSAATVEERKRLFDEMGEYKIINKKPKRNKNGLLVQLLRALFSWG